MFPIPFHRRRAQQTDQTVPGKRQRSGLRTTAMVQPLLLPVAAILLLLPWPPHTATALSPTTPTYQYFAIGSNVDPTTMLCLRNLHPLQASAAVLPGYRLAFMSLSPTRADNKQTTKTPWSGEPSSAAYAQPVASGESSSRDEDSLHGVVYELTMADFVRLSISEGVPLAYRWESCTVYPYQGELNGAAGRKALSEGNTTFSVEAQVLVAAPPFLSKDDDDAFIPPSASYLNIIQQGAALWDLDQSYQDQLARIPTAAASTNPFTMSSGRLLQTARMLNPRTQDIEKLLQGINRKKETN